MLNSIDTKLIIIMYIFLLENSQINALSIGNALNNIDSFMYVYITIIIIYSY